MEKIGHFKIEKTGSMKMAMVDISDKPEVFREATATGTIKLKPETIRLIGKGEIAKGDPLFAAKIAGILAAKKTSTLIPLCHPLPLTNVEVKMTVLDKSTVRVMSTVKTKAPTGVEMEALVATAISLLTIWDMVKQYEKNAEGQYPSTVIENIRVVKKIKEVNRSERKRKKA
jgi:cyclic pyranopterin phosphate synthase